MAVAFVGLAWLLVWLYTVKFRKLRHDIKVWRKSHGDAIDTLADGMKVSSSTDCSQKMIFVSVSKLRKIKSITLTLKNKEHDRQNLPCPTHYRQLQVVFCTTQTLVLVTDNHVKAGGEQPPWLYHQFLQSLNWVTMDLMAAVPGTGCLFKGFGFVTDLLFMTLGYAVVAAALICHWYYKTHVKSDDQGWRTLKKLVRLRP